MEVISTRRAAGVDDFEMHKEVEIISHPEKALSMSGSLNVRFIFDITAD